MAPRAIHQAAGDQGPGEARVIETLIRIDGFDALRDAIGLEDALRELRRRLTWAGDEVERNLRLEAKVGRRVHVTVDDSGHEIVCLGSDLSDDGKLGATS